MEFSNEVVEKELLPQIEEIQFNKLEKSYNTLLRWESIITVVLIAAGICTAFFFIPELTSIPMLYIFITVLLVILSFIVWVGFNSFKYKGYALRQHDIIFKSGIFFRSTTIISFNRVQHIEINHGPLDRYFNIAGLTLYTAGGSSSDLTIPGLSMEDANRIKEWIMKKKTSDEEE
ncbi:MAG: PH domain-containing protein [Saprospiraceae bacterium]|nr:PH domain-containing protein [Saprospiraceae bacterium]